mmetsp:Transcript_17934/g.39096  ORF Transcript_17934/g.39096 Transcript_17934/m.39096 type:complete len:98 (-) Transcript_17934:162-455(-)
MTRRSSQTAWGDSFLCAEYFQSHQLEERHFNPTFLISGSLKKSIILRYLISKPTCADYSATTGSQTTGHYVGHVWNTKQQKSILHSQKNSAALQSCG